MRTMQKKQIMDMQQIRKPMGWLLPVCCALLAVAQSGRAATFMGAAAGNQLFSDAGNWDTFPTAGSSVSFAAHSANVNPAQVDSAFPVLAGTNRLASVAVTAAAAETTYLEILDGGYLEGTSVVIGWQTTQLARPGDVVLRSGGTLKAGNGGLGGYLYVGGASPGQLLVEDGATLRATKMTVNSKGTLIFDFGAGSVSTMAGTSTSTGSVNQIDGLLRLDLGALSTMGSYTLIDSQGSMLSGALKTWLDGGGGSRSGTGNVATANFEIVNGGDIHWTLTTADVSGRDLVLNVVPARARVGLSGITNGMLRVSSTQLPTSGTNYLQMSSNLADGAWSDISYAVGVQSTNWLVPSHQSSAFFRVNRKPPNIVFIMADDLGYNDLSCQGATKLSTPNIDRIAQEGMRFTDAHAAAAICCPSRYSMLTGRYPWRRSSSTWAAGAAALLIESGRMTTASLLKQAGYTTGIVGKWHLGFGTKENPVDWYGELKPGPLEVGFDYFFGDVNNRWGCYVENHRILGLTTNDPPLVFNTSGQRISGGDSAWTMVNEENATVLHEKAVAFIEQNKNKPFYLHYVPNNVHVPLTPNPRFQGTSQCGAYGDFVHELDWSVGEILATLDRLGLAENTLVIFTSDNGGVYNASAMQAGHRCDAPLNGQKVDVWDGGTRIPFLARWPGHIPAGVVSGRLLCLTDMLATFAAFSGQGFPYEAGTDSFNALPLLLNQAPSASDRRNLIVQSSFGVVAMPQNWLARDIWAVREGSWKLVLGQGSGNTTTENKLLEYGFVNSDYTPDGQLKPGAPPMQLYDLDTDLGETNNVYNAHPDTVDGLNALFEQLRDAGRSRP